MGKKKVPVWEIKDDHGLTFSENNHQYRAQKRSVPSVTTIIGLLDKPALIHWAAKLTAQYLIDRIPSIKSGKIKFTAENAAEIFVAAKREHMEVSKKARDIGSEVHDAIEAFLRDGKPPKKMSTHARKGFNSYMVWHEEHNLSDVIAIEQIVFHPKMRYAGKLDILAVLNGKVYIIDIKTSNAFYEPDMPMQLSAYKEAVQSYAGIKVEGTGIIRLDKETGWPSWRDYSLCMDESFAMFSALVQFENARRQGMAMIKECAKV